MEHVPPQQRGWSDLDASQEHEAHLARKAADAGVLYSLATKKLTAFAEKHGLKSLSVADLIAYRQAREKLVERTRESAVAALDNAAVHRNHADRAVDSVLTVLRRLGDDLADAAALAESTSDGLTKSGLDPRLCPVVPSAPDMATTTLTEQVRAKPDPEAEPLEVQRRQPPAVAPDGAVHLDTTPFTLDEVVEQVVALVHRSTGAGSAT